MNNKIISSRNIPIDLKQLFLITKLEKDHQTNDIIKEFINAHRDIILPPNWHRNTQIIKNQISEKSKRKKIVSMQISIKETHISKINDYIKENYTKGNDFAEYIITWYAQEEIKIFLNHRK